MSKYNNKKVCVNGLYFNSKKEANRYIKLLEKQQNGEISSLETQVKYVLILSQYETFERFGKNGQRLKDGKKLLEREIAYVADFRYIDNISGETIVEDVKGYRNKKAGAYAMFIAKRKMMLYFFGIRINEV